LRSVRLTSTRGGSSCGRAVSLRGMQTGGILVRIVMREYLAAEIAWD
jgi:hypothetical protein